MEPKEKRLIEIGIGATFILFLLLVVLLVLGGTGGSKTTITNSFNTYNIDSSPHKDPVYSKSYMVDRDSYSKVYVKDYDRYDYYDRYQDYNYLDYSSWSNHDSIKTIFRTNMDKYEVYVKNRDSIGGYFTVEFYLEDYYGEVTKEKVTQYVAANGEKRFVFKDISPYDDYQHWWYEIVPKTKAPTNVYYSDGDYVRSYERGSSTITYLYRK